MSKRNKSIPINEMTGHLGSGIAIERLDLSTLGENELKDLDEGNETHRHDRHSFFLLEKGTVHLEIDFQKYQIDAPSVVYVHPDQVHQTIALAGITVSSLGMTNENLNPVYLKLLEEIVPAKPLLLDESTYKVISTAVAMAIEYAKRTDDQLYHSLLKDSCNVIVALIVSQYLLQIQQVDYPTRFETVTKTFRELLSKHYTQLKRPSAYAEKLNISAPYLNECVKNATGYSVSHHIQHRIMLEAKRLLIHSSQSVKEIAMVLGYDDYPYFSRLFTKVNGITALAFRNKNRD